MLVGGGGGGGSNIIVTHSWCLETKALQKTTARLGLPQQMPLGDKTFLVPGPAHKVVRILGLGDPAA